MKRRDMTSPKTRRNAEGSMTLHDKEEINPARHAQQNRRKEDNQDQVQQKYQKISRGERQKKRKERRRERTCITPGERKNDIGPETIREKPNEKKPKQ